MQLFSGLQNSFLAQDSKTQDRLAERILFGIYEGLDRDFKQKLRQLISPTGSGQDIDELLREAEDFGAELPHWEKRLKDLDSIKTDLGHIQAGESRSENRKNTHSQPSQKAAVNSWRHVFQLPDESFVERYHDIVRALQDKKFRKISVKN